MVCFPNWPWADTAHELNSTHQWLCQVLVRGTDTSDLGIPLVQINLHHLTLVHLSWLAYQPSLHLWSSHKTTCNLTPTPTWHFSRSISACFLSLTGLKSDNKKMRPLSIWGSITEKEGICFLFRSFICFMPWEKRQEKRMNYAEADWLSFSNFFFLSDVFIFGESHRQERETQEVSVISFLLHPAQVGHCDNLLYLLRRGRRKRRRDGNACACAHTRVHTHMCVWACELISLTEIIMLKRPAMYRNNSRRCLNEGGVEREQKFHPLQSYCLSTRNRSEKMRRWSINPYISRCSNTYVCEYFEKGLEGTHLTDNSRYLWGGEGNCMRARRDFSVIGIAWNCLTVGIWKK